jgi:hypothetical protein
LLSKFDNPDKVYPQSSAISPHLLFEDAPVFGFFVVKRKSKMKNGRFHIISFSKLFDRPFMHFLPHLGCPDLLVAKILLAFFGLNVPFVVFAVFALSHRGGYLG